MSVDRLPFFLARTSEWWAVAAALRARGVPEGDPALQVWREAAWCHLLFAAGRYPAAVARLRATLQNVGGTLPPDPVPLPDDESGALFAAADLFVQLRAAVYARFLAAFDRPAA